MVTFEYPYVLGLILIFIFLAKLFPLKAQSIIFPHLYMLSSSVRFSYLQFILKWLGISMVIIALASPVIEDNVVENKKDGFDIVLGIDSSYSMSEYGFDRANTRIDKFTVVKEILKDFIPKRENDNLAFVVFGDFAYVASPLTFDKVVLNEILSYLSIGIAGKNTAIYDAIAQSVKILKNSTAKSKILILLTDGMNTAGNIPDKVAIELAKKHNIKIYTVGIGNQLDIVQLKKIADESGGESYIARDKTMLQRIYEEIDKLERSEIKSNSYVKKDYLYRYPLFIAIISLLLLIYLKNRNN